MALDNIPTLGPGGFNGNLDKVLVHKNGGSEVACSLLTLTNSALNIAGVYLDTVNQRVGINNPNPVTALDVIGAGRFYQAFAIGVPSLFAYNGRAEADSTLRLDNPGGGKLYFGGFGLLNETNASFGQLSAPSARVHIKGSGSTSATTSLLVQNSNALTNLQVTDDGQVSVINEGKFNVVRYGNTLLSTGQATSSLSTYNSSVTVTNTQVAFNTLGNYGWSFLQDLFQGYHPMIIQDATYKARETSALVELNSKTRGFLKPKMTTAQKNAIVTPTAGLEVYDTDLNRPCFFNGTSWITL